MTTITMTASIPRTVGLQLPFRLMSRTTPCSGTMLRSFSSCSRQLRPSPPRGRLLATPGHCGAALTLCRVSAPATPFGFSTAPLSRQPTLLETFAKARRLQSTAAATLDAPPSATSTSASSSALSNVGSGTSSRSSTPLLTRPSVALHLYTLAFLVYAIIVVGGLTRLTESGLSITEWNPGFKGMRLPITREEWEAEWDKYKQTPEFLLLNQRMSLEDFKAIYMWEWGHRILGRVIGVSFVLPAAWFIGRKWVGKDTRWKLVAIALGIGFQGFLGWFMVKSGLTAPQPSGTQKTVTVPVPVIKDDHPNSTANTHDGTMRFDATTTVTVPSSSAQSASVAPAEWTPRVSHFRLAMHMGTAFLVYLGMLHTGLAIQRDYKLAKGNGTVAGVRLSSTATAASSSGSGSVATLTQRLINTLSHPLVRSHSRLTKLVTCLVFTTAMSGALVAGLDAGLVYNEFPTMGEGRLTPPMDELFDDRFAQAEDGSDKVWRNLAQNPVTVQLIHRTLAISTLLSVYALAWKTRSVARRYAEEAARQEARTAAGGMSAVSSGRVATKRTAARPSGTDGALLAQFPRTAVRLAYVSAGVVTVQATLGITTLLYMVPIPLASMHQAGSVALLSVLVGMVASMRTAPKHVLRALAAAAAAGPSSNGAVNQAVRLQHQRILQKVLK